jgi:ribonuclease Z
MSDSRFLATVIDIVLTGTGSPLPDPSRAGPSTLVHAGSSTFLVDAGRGVLMRTAGVGVGAAGLSALLLTHLHSDHITDLNDVITTRWVTTFEPSPLRVIGPPGTREVVDAVICSLREDIGYRTRHHADLDGPPPVDVHEATEGVVFDTDGATVRVGPTDHRPVEPTIAFRVEHGGRAVVVAGDTVPCDSLDALCAGADALVITAVRKDILAATGIPRLLDVTDYHSSVEDAAQTAKRAGVATLVLTHYVPALTPDTVEDWRSRAAMHFDGEIVLGDDLTKVTI